MDYLSWFFGIQISQNEHENVLNCPSFHLAFWADVFFELILGLPNQGRGRLLKSGPAEEVIECQRHERLESTRGGLFPLS